MSNKEIENKHHIESVENIQLSLLEYLISDTDLTLCHSFTSYVLIDVFTRMEVYESIDIISLFQFVLEYRKSIFSNDIMIPSFTSSLEQRYYSE